jgi:hypothetical protein
VQLLCSEATITTNGNAWCRNRECQKYRSPEDEVTLAWNWRSEGSTSGWIDNTGGPGSTGSTPDAESTPVPSTQQVTSARETAASADKLLRAARTYAEQAKKALRELEAEELERSEPDNTDAGNSITLLVGLVADLRIQRLDNLRQNVQQAFEQTAASTGPIREDASSLTTLSLPMTMPPPVADADVNIESLPLVRGGHELGERSDARSRTPTMRRPTTSRTIEP